MGNGQPSEREVLMRASTVRWILWAMVAANCFLSAVNVAIAIENNDTISWIFQGSAALAAALAAAYVLNKLAALRSLTSQQTCRHKWECVASTGPPLSPRDQFYMDQLLNHVMRTEKPCIGHIDDSGQLHIKDIEP
jgi:amino acid permease